MQSSVQVAQPTHSRGVGHLVLYGGINVVSVIAFVTLHELTHMIVGRLLGLPASFASPVTVSVPTSVIGHVDGWRLALMNGIAPLTTMILGVVAALLLTRYGRRWPDLLNRFVGWWALFGVAYIGFEMIGTSAPTVYAGSGADPAAVAGFLGLSDPLRALISFVALLFFLISGLLLVPTLAAIEHLPPTKIPGLKDLNLTPSRWRRTVAVILIAIVLIVGVLNTISAARGNHQGFAATELLAPMLWAIALALATTWQTPFARIVRAQWIWPLLIGWVVLGIGGILANASDYLVAGLYLIGPVISVAMCRIDVASDDI